MEEIYNERVFTLFEDEFLELVNLNNEERLVNVRFVEAPDKNKIEITTAQGSKDDDKKRLSGGYQPRS